jgi:hypothetical protein
METAIDEHELIMYEDQIDKATTTLYKLNESLVEMNTNIKMADSDQMVYDLLTDANDLVKTVTDDPASKAVFGAAGHETFKPKSDQLKTKKKKGGTEELPSGMVDLTADPLTAKIDGAVVGVNTLQQPLIPELKIEALRTSPAEDTEKPWSYTYASSSDYYGPYEPGTMEYLRYYPLPYGPKSQGGDEGLEFWRATQKKGGEQLKRPIYLMKKRGQSGKYDRVKKEEVPSEIRNKKGLAKRNKFLSAWMKSNGYEDEQEIKTAPSSRPPPPPRAAPRSPRDVRVGADVRVAKRKRV